MTWRRMIGRGVSAGGVSVVLALAAGCTSGGTAAPEELPAPTTTVVSNTEFAGCSECHLDIDEVRPSDRPATLIFNHAEHDLASESVGCGSCHPVETHVDDRTIKPAMETCFDCHGVDAADPLPCSSCHPLSVVPRPRRRPPECGSHMHSLPPRAAVLRYLPRSPDATPGWLERE